MQNVASKVDIFKGLSRKRLGELIGWLEKKEFRKGQIIFKEGDRPDGLYLLSSGEVAIDKDSSQGRFRLARLETPAFFGEASLLVNAKRTATVRTLSKVKVGYLPLKLFRQKLNTHSTTAFLISVNLTRLLAERVAETSRRVAKAAAQSA